MSEYVKKNIKYLGNNVTNQKTFIKDVTGVWITRGWCPWYRINMAKTLILQN